MDARDGVLEERVVDATDEEELAAKDGTVEKMGVGIVREADWKEDDCDGKESKGFELWGPGRMGDAQSSVPKPRRSNV